MESELAEAVAGALLDQGCHVRRVRDGEPAGVEADVLLLLVNLANFPAYARMLSRRRSQRPRTIVWQMDPLPPVETPKDAERLGLGAAAWRDRLGTAGIPPRSPGIRPARMLAKLRQWTYKQVSRPGYVRAARSMRGSPGWRWHDVDWPQIRSCFQSWHWIHRGLAEGWINQAISSTRQRQQFLASRGFDSDYLPVPAYSTLGRRLYLERDVDVLFLGGTRHGRRRHLWGHLKSGLKSHGLRVSEITGDCYGEARTQVLNRTRVLVNLHNYPWNPAWIRFHIATLCGAAIASEPIDDTEPYAAGRDYLAASAIDLPAAIIRLLRNKTECQRLVDSAIRICQADLTVAGTIEKLRSLAQRHEPQSAEVRAAKRLD
jgi:hypothetical protein